MKHNYDEPTMQAAIDAACKITANSTHRPSFALLRLIESNTTDDWPKEQHSRLHLAEKLLELLPEAPPPESKTCSVCNWTNVSLLNLGEPGDPRWVCPGCCKRAFDQTQPPVVGGKTPGQVNHDAVANGDYDTYKKWSELSERGKRDVERGASAVLAAFGKPQLSTLRPIAEAGEVPDGAVRYYFIQHPGFFGTGAQRPSPKDTHYADILPPEAEAPAVEADPYAELKAAHAEGKTIQYNCGSNSKPEWEDLPCPTFEGEPHEYRIKPAETFTAHGKTWNVHTPGDPMPCDGKIKIDILDRSGVVYCDQPAHHHDSDFWTAEYWNPIIGWRYADEPSGKSTSDATITPWTPAVGNVVTLKSGSPKMTVTALSVHKDNASVSWFNDGVVNSASFNVSTLIPA